jgi:hypothetical protein
MGFADTEAAGNLKLVTNEVIQAGSGTPVTLSANQLFEGAHFVDLHVADGTRTATSSLPRMEPTGINAVDASLAAVQRGDIDGLLTWTELSELLCGPVSAKASHSPLSVSVTSSQARWFRCFPRPLASRTGCAIRGPCGRHSSSRLVGRMR